MTGNTAAQIFFLKTRGGWREGNRMEVSGQDGRALAAPGAPLEAAMMEAAYKRALDKCSKG